MTTTQGISTTFGITEIMRIFFPKLINQVLTFIKKEDTDVDGTSFDMTVSIAGNFFSYTLDNGNKLTVSSDEIKTPMIRADIADDMSISINIDEIKFLKEFMPLVIGRTISSGMLGNDLTGTDFSFVMEIDGRKYSYIAKNGSEIKVLDSDQESPMARMIINKTDLEKLIAIDNIDLLLSAGNNINKTRYDALSQIKGKIDTELKNNDGSSSAFTFILNGSATPTTKFLMKTSDFIKITKKEAHPVNLFMTGAMAIEGDIGFAMSIQPLFV